MEASNGDGTELFAVLWKHHHWKETRSPVEKLPSSWRESRGSSPVQLAQLNMTWRTFTNLVSSYAVEVSVEDKKKCRALANEIKEKILKIAFGTELGVRQ